MPFDRDETLRKAEKLLRQGKLDLAIAEYRGVVEADPSDWNTANTLGDLYFRAGQTDRAVTEYTRIADHFAGEGFFPKAAALYRKILKIKPDEERATWNLGQTSAQQGLPADARASFQLLLERRRARGDHAGVAEVRIRLGELDGADLETRLTGARARAELGRAPAAAEQLKQIAADLQEKGKDVDALNVLREAAGLAPDDAELKRRLMDTYASRGDFEAARTYATGFAELKELAEELLRQGRHDEGLSVLSAAAEAAPDDVEVRARVARAHIERGDATSARAQITPEVAASDPNLRWALAEMELRAGHISEGTTLLGEILAADAQKRDALVTLGCSVGEVNADAGYECVDVVAAAAIAADQWAEAAAALNEYVHRVPHHIPALMRLVEICVDGGLEATMHSAQAQLADAYLEIGAGPEARIIAEDLVAREPWERANLERFRRALVLLGESNIDGIIAERLSGQSPFMSTDILWSGEATSLDIPLRTAGPELRTAPVPAEPALDPAPQPKAGASFHTIDLSAILGEVPSGETAGRVRTPAPEVDLSGALHDIKGGAGTAAPVENIETVLKAVRDEAVHEAASPEVAEQHFQLATVYIEMALPDEAIKALEVSARSLHHRFRAAALLGKLHMDKGDLARAVEWFERAAEAPAPTPVAGHQLLYELALALEAQGESARALAVLLELQSEAGEYRDLAERLEHLMGS